MTRIPVYVQRIKEARVQLTSLDPLNESAFDLISEVIWDIQHSARSIRLWFSKGTPATTSLDNVADILVYLDLRSPDAPKVLDEAAKALDECVSALGY